MWSSLLRVWFDVEVDVVGLKLTGWRQRPKWVRRRSAPEVHVIPFRDDNPRPSFSQRKPSEPGKQAGRGVLTF